MKTLIVMRHAKSSWSDPGAADIDRPLNARGRSSAKAIGEWLTFGNSAPELVLCSSARRTAETWQNMELDAEVKYLPALYHAGPTTILNCVRDATTESVMVLGHNPGIAAFAHEIVSEHPTHERFDDYPTAATMVASFDGGWRELGAKKATARAFTVPRDLIE